MAILILIAYASLFLGLLFVGFLFALYLMGRRRPAPCAPFPIAKAPIDRLKRGLRKKDVPAAADAIVIGAGPSGLSLAVLLARRGLRVLVLEQHDRAGGGLHTFEEHGFEFDRRDSAALFSIESSALAQPWPGCSSPRIALRFHDRTPGSTTAASSGKARTSARSSTR